MPQTVPSEPLAAQVAQLTDDVDALDRSVIDAGLTASQALARAEALEQMLSATLAAAGSMTQTPARPASRTRRVSRLEARRHRIHASGLTLLQGGASS